mgnify:FL=1
MEVDAGRILTVMVDVNSAAGEMRLMALQPLAACASPVAFAVLAVVLGGLGTISWFEAILASIAVALVFVPTGLWAAAAVQRRLAEAMLVPAAFAMTMVGSATMRHMVLPPLLLLAIWAAAATARDRVPDRRLAVFAAMLGLAAKAAVGLGLSGFGALPVALSLAIAAALPWMAVRRWGWRAAELAALLGAVLPWQSWPLAAGVLLVTCFTLGVTGGFIDRNRLVLGWMPGMGAAALLAASLATWPGFGVSNIFPDHGWVARLVVVATFIASSRLRPGVAGAAWLIATLFAAPVRAPAPEQRAFDLTAELGQLEMSAGTGGDYVIDLDVANDGVVSAQNPLAVLWFAGNDHLIFAGSSDQSTVWRPHGMGAGTRWRATVRSRFVVPKGVRPVLFRHPELAADVKERVETIGTLRATPPRYWMLPQGLLVAAAAVAAIQIA